jgi:hypothetical protein
MRLHLNIDLPLLRHACLSMCFIVLATSSSAQPAFNPYSPYIPPTDRFWLPLPPMSPTSASECQGYQADFDKQEATLAAEHSACLEALKSETRHVDPNNMAVCSVASCQSIHDAWQNAVNAQKAVIATVSDCQNTVSGFLSTQAARQQAQQVAAEKQKEQAEARQEQLADEHRRDLSEIDPVPNDRKRLEDAAKRQAKADAIAMQAAQDERQQQLNELAKRTDKRTQEMEGLNNALDSATVTANQQSAQSAGELAQLDAGLLPAAGSRATGTNNAPPTPSADDYVDTSAAAAVPMTSPATLTAPASPDQPHTIVFGTQTPPTHPVPGPDIQYENMDAPGLPSVITYQTAQTPQPLYIWAPDDAANPVKYCGNDANSSCEIDYPGIGGVTPERPQFTRPTPVANPKSAADCSALAQSWEQLSRAVYENHWACRSHWSKLMATGQPDADDSFEPGSKCIFRACQEVHNSVVRLLNEKQVAVAACYKALP